LQKEMQENQKLQKEKLQEKLEEQEN